MKTSRIKSLVYLTIISLTVASFLSGCATRWQDTYGKLLATIAQTTDSAMRGWATYVVVAKVPEANQQSIRSAYGQYQLAMTTAQAAYKASVASGDQTGIVAASAALRAAQAGLFTLINSFNPSAKLSPTP